MTCYFTNGESDGNGCHPPVWGPFSSRPPSEKPIFLPPPKCSRPPGQRSFFTTPPCGGKRNPKWDNVYIRPRGRVYRAFLFSTPHRDGLPFALEESIAEGFIEIKYWPGGGELRLASTKFKRSAFGKAALKTTT